LLGTVTCKFKVSFCFKKKKEMFQFGSMLIFFYSRFDCDLDQALELPLGSLPQGKRNIFTIESFNELSNGLIRTDMHCYGCTAGAGSSCTGAVVKEE
jgi:hypothetical protein